MSEISQACRIFDHGLERSRCIRSVSLPIRKITPSCSRSKAQLYSSCIPSPKSDLPIVARPVAFNSAFRKSHACHDCMKKYLRYRSRMCPSRINTITVKCKTSRRFGLGEFETTPRRPNRVAACRKRLYSRE